MLYLLHFICFMHYSKFISIPSFFLSSSSRFILALEVPQISVILVASMMKLLAKPSLESVTRTFLKAITAFEATITFGTIPAETLDSVSTSSPTATTSPTLVSLFRMATSIRSRTKASPTSTLTLLAEIIQTSSAIEFERGL